MKKFVLLIVVAVLLMPVWAGAQDSSGTNSVLKTGVWEGKMTGAVESAIKLSVESVADKHIKAKLNLVDWQNTMVELSGDIVDSFGDFVEQSRWQFVIKDKKFTDGNWVKLTDVKLIQGNWDLKQTYYGFLSHDLAGNSIVGCWYGGNDPQPRGRFELHFPEP
jgi:hypothetical protein